MRSTCSGGGASDTMTPRLTIHAHLATLQDWTLGYYAKVAQDLPYGKFLAVWIVLAAAASGVGQFQAEMSSDAYLIQGMAERGFLPKFLGKRCDDLWIRVRVRVTSSRAWPRGACCQSSWARRAAVLELGLGFARSAMLLPPSSSTILRHGACPIQGCKRKVSAIWV